MALPRPLLVSLSTFPYKILPLTYNTQQLPCSLQVFSPLFTFHSLQRKNGCLPESSATPSPTPPAGARPRGERLVSVLARARTDSEGTTMVAELLRSRVRL